MSFQRPRPGTEYEFKLATARALTLFFPLGLAWPDLSAVASCPGHARNTVDSSGCRGHTRL